MSFHQLLTHYPVPTRGIDDAASHVLSDKQLLRLPHVEKPKKLTDGGGLYLHQLPSGVRTWRLKYRLRGKPDEVTIGRFPEVTLAEARADAAAIRRLVAAGSDPKSWADSHAAAERAAAARETETFGFLAEAYFRTASITWSETHRRDVRRILDELIEGRAMHKGYPHAGIGLVPIRDLRKSHIRPVIEAVVARGAMTYVRDLLLYTRKVVEFFNAGHDDQLADPTAGLRSTLPPAPEEQHHRSLAPDKMPAFLRAIRLVSCEPETRLAVRLLLLTAVRNGELRQAAWSEFDIEQALWTIPAERMKYRRKVRAAHLVPLSEQALAALADLQSLTGEKTLLLPGERGNGCPISEGTILGVIKRAGYAGRMTAHGFRSVFSTWANEKGFRADAIERQLSHVEGNKVRGAYNSAEYLPEREAMMRAWGAQIEAWEKTSPTQATEDHL